MLPRLSSAPLVCDPPLIQRWVHSREHRWVSFRERRGIVVVADLEECQLGARLLGEGRAPQACVSPGHRSRCQIMEAVDRWARDLRRELAPPRLQVTEVLCSGYISLESRNADR